MDWSGCVSTAVSSAASVVNNLTASANDQKKAVKAAKSAGKEAKKNAEKLYPSWDTKGTKDLAASEGITTRAAWKKARAEAGNSAYDEAYDEVWQMYVKAKDAEINAVSFQTSQEYLDHELAMAEVNASALSNAYAMEFQSSVSPQQMPPMQYKSAGSGCVGFAFALVASGSGLVYILINLI